ncbi:hypothetical protein SK128_020045 [Halocaridina rubra]|uniref:Uncharacterized protein n=1 Tax=Halocaridina rubra TaxID=373956 RepID=A0AAN8X2N8_HALRR
MSFRSVKSGVGGGSGYGRRQAASNLLEQLDPVSHHRANSRHNSIGRASHSVVDWPMASVARCDTTAEALRVAGWPMEPPTHYDTTTEGESKFTKQYLGCLVDM